MNIPTYLTGSTYSQANRILRTRIAACLAKHELTPTGWSLLGIVLSSREGVRLNNAAQQLSVKAPLVTTLSHEFIKRELIQRIPHPLDGRAKLLVITAKGKQFCKKVEEELGNVLGVLLDGLSEAEIETYRKVLETIIANDASSQNS